MPLLTFMLTTLIQLKLKENLWGLLWMLIVWCSKNTFDRTKKKRNCRLIERATTVTLDRPPRSNWIGTGLRSLWSSVFHGRVPRRSGGRNIERERAPPSSTDWPDADQSSQQGFDTLRPTTWSGIFLLFHFRKSRRRNDWILESWFASNFPVSNFLNLSVRASFANECYLNVVFSPYDIIQRWLSTQLNSEIAEPM